MQDSEGQILQIEYYPTAISLGIAPHAPVPVINIKKVGFNIRLYPGGKKLYTLKEKNLNSFTAIPLDNFRIVTKLSNNVAIWNIKDGSFKIFNCFASLIYDEVAAVSPDEKLIATTPAWQLVLNDLEKNTSITLSENECRSPIFSPNGHHLAYLESSNPRSKEKGDLVIRNLQDNQITKTGIQIQGGDIMEGRIVWSPSGKYIATIFSQFIHYDLSAELRVWNIEGKPVGKPTTLFQFVRNFSPIWVGGEKPHILVFAFAPNQQPNKSNKYIFKPQEIPMDVK